MKILAVSDQVVERLYTLASQGHFREVELVLACGDLPYTYLEYLVSTLNVPLYYVPGNHDPDYNPRMTNSRAEGCTNLDLRLARHRGLLLAGLGGSIRYRPDGVNQYNQTEAQARALRLLPSLLWNRLRGRRVDILICHSPPFGIHDSDGAHAGLKALNLLIRWARPRYLLHGHTHFYRNNLEESVTTVDRTTVMNIFPYKVIELQHA
jgi:Icc-related predicted phosphoesterase